MAVVPPKIGLQLSDFPSTGISDPTSVQKLLTSVKTFSDSTIANLGSLAPGSNMGEVKSVTIQTPADDWLYVGKTGAPAFQNGATNQSASDDVCRFRKDSSGAVWMEGLLTASAANNLFFQLPAAYVPKYSVNFATAVSVGGAETYGRLRILGNATTPGTNAGNVGIVGANPTTWGSICASFQADPSTGPGVLSCFPLQVNCNTQNIGLVLVGKVYDQTSSTQTPVAVGTPSWVSASGGFKLLNLPGLLLGKKYQVTFWVLPEGT